MKIECGFGGIRSYDHAATNSRHVCIAEVRLYDFKGNSLRGARQFASDYKNIPDWSQNPALDSETFTGTTAYDALNRATAVTTPDNSIYRPTFNEANLLETVDVNLRVPCCPVC